MKTILVVALLGISLGATAQSSSISKDITDDGRTLSIQIDIEQPNRVVHYKRSFAVSSMSQAERQALKNRVLDSLNVNMPPEAATWQNSAETRVDVAAVAPRVSAGRADSRATVVGGSQPYAKEVIEDPEQGTLFMRYRYEKDGEEVIYERTVKARGKSERDKQRIIAETEQEIGLPHEQK